MSELTHEERHERPHRSLFGPIVLIALGLFFLFGQVNPLTDLHWLDVLRLWPLLLIFLGLNILVLQVPRPYNTWLSGLVAVVAVLVFGYVLVYGLVGTRFASRIGLEMGNWQTEAIQFAAEDVGTAVYNLTLGAPGAHLYALEDSRNLIEGTVIYQDDYLFETNVANSEATIKLAPNESNEGWIFWPDYWRDYSEVNRWQVGLNPRVPASLSLMAVAGSSQIDLRELLLEDLYVETNAGEMELFLPGGNYDGGFTTNAGVTKVMLPEDGRHEIELQVNAGSVTLTLPPGMEARIETDSALGAFNATNGRLEPVNGQENVWQTVGYEGVFDQVDLTVHTAVGEVTVK